MALGLIVISLFALIAVQAHAMRADKMSKKRHTATVVLASHMAKAEADLETDFTAVVDRPLTPDTDQPQYEVEISAVPDSLPKLKVIRGRVVWKEAGGTLSLSLESKVDQAD